MSENPAGIFVLRDELSGWLDMLDRSGREGERAFFLTAWAGDTGHTIDRVGRGTIYVEHCCLSMLGGIQPARLRSYLVDALRDGPSNDGLIQRFQLLIWPDTRPDWTLVDRPPDAAAQKQAEKVFLGLVELDAESPLPFRFSSEAQRLLNEWLRNLEAKVRGDELHPALVAHLSKFRSLMPSLALLFELADLAAEGSVGFVGSVEGILPIIREVSPEHVKQAIAWCDYLESHARRVYSCITTPQMRAARELADKIKRKKAGAHGSFSCRDVYLKGWSGLDSPGAVQMAVEVLEDALWLRREYASDTGGRPGMRYIVNPKVYR